jgi:hypothetical protein
MTFLQDKLQYELDEIATARSECILHEETLVVALDRGQLSDAAEHARLAAIKASQLQIMLSHVSTVIGLEIERQADKGDDFENSNQVYGVAS